MHQLLALFHRVGIHRFVPKALAQRMEEGAALLRMSEWKARHEKTELGPDCDRWSFFAKIMEEEHLDEAILYLEFGVAAGRSVRWWTENNSHATSRFVGFDTFAGLPENWDNVSKGTFDQGGKTPAIEDERCRFEKGRFCETLPSFLAREDLDKRKVIHLDADLYGATLFLLTRLWEHLQTDDIIFMGDFCSLRHPTHVFEAFRDFRSAYPFPHRVLASSNFGRQVAVKVE